MTCHKDGGYNITCTHHTTKSKPMLGKYLDLQMGNNNYGCGSQEPSQNWVLTLGPSGTKFTQD